MPNSNSPAVIRELISAGVTAHGPLDLADAAGREKAERLFESATCFVMPSRFEPFGMVYAEAAAAGVPSIGSTGGGAADAIGDGGLLVEPGNESALLNAMVAMSTRATRMLGRSALAKPTCSPGRLSLVDSCRYSRFRAPRQSARRERAPMKQPDSHSAVPLGVGEAGALRRLSRTLANPASLAVAVAVALAFRLAVYLADRRCSSTRPSSRSMFPGDRRQD